MAKKVYQQVYTGILGSGPGIIMVSGDPHVELPAADLWTPQGDITIIAAKIESGMNALPNSALGDLGGLYCFADLSVVAKRDEERSQIIRVHAQSDPIETPTIGEHELSHPLYKESQIVFPAGYGIDLDRWHPVYLNMGYRMFFAAGDFEAFASGIIWYVER